MNTIFIVFLCLMLACPVSAILVNVFLMSRPIVAARWAGYCIGFGFVLGLGLLSYLSLSPHPEVYRLISLNTLSFLLCSLVLLVGFIVHRFALRYMHGDRLYRRFFILLSSLTFTAMLMVIADQIFLFWAAWMLSNILLVLLMMHKQEWVAAKNSAQLSFYTLFIGSLCLLIACIILSLTCATSSIDSLGRLSSSTDFSSFPYFMSICLLVLSALVQSGLFPFHQWLISSLNSPTPVSAVMHAGLVNGGGILLVKFASIIILYPSLLNVLFVLGAISALVGTIWKLMQHDIKRMLACSTMAQMGFMIMQCGVGLFAAAIAHLCWHGLFKAYLFLSSGSAVKQKKSEIHLAKVSPLVLIISLVGGVAAMAAFAFVTHKSLSMHEASSFVLFFAFIAGAQLMLTWVRTYQKLINIFSGFLLAVFAGFMYGASIQLVQGLIPSIAALEAPRLSLIHWTIMGLFGSLWIAFNLGLYQQISNSKLGCWLYMHLFNLSQPHRKTVTVLRNDYNY